MAVQDVVGVGVGLDGSRLTVVDARHHRFVDADVDQHVIQVGDAHQLLAFTHRLALGNDRLLRAAAEPALLRLVIDHHAVLGRVDLALLDFGHDVVEVSELLLMDLLLGAVVGVVFLQLGFRLRLDTFESASGLIDLILEVGLRTLLHPVDGIREDTPLFLNFFQPQFKTLQS